MATDFFQQQDAARRGTTRLVVLFGLAVLAIMASVELLLAASMGFLGRSPETGAIDWTIVTDPQLLAVSILGTIIIVGGGSLYKIAQLRAGGRVVAEHLGGRLLTAGTADAMEQRLLNVVEEMAIASGTATPPVYLMDQEEGINAFAAGSSPDDAVVGVTRGTATRLDRDELQGVIAHEFSHILNGDMRLNLRLIGLLHGILIIGLLGYFILRMSFFTGGRRRSRDGKDGLPIMALGAGLAVIGFAGTFFGNLIKAAVNRQREYLADASAVQFTRQPAGLAGALRKIGGFTAGSAIQNPNAPEASHLFFGRATSGFSALFSTHPPIEARIRRIDPSWDGHFPEGVPIVDAAVGPRRPVAGTAAFAGGAVGGAPTSAGLTGAVASIGQPSQAHIHHAASLIESLPGELLSAAREPYGARAVVFALLLDRSTGLRQQQLAQLEAAADPGVFEETLKLARLVEPLHATLRLPLLEIALPALRALSERQHDLFLRNIVALTEADKTVDLFEWAIHRILHREITALSGTGQGTRVRYRTVAAVRAHCEQLMSALAYVGHHDAEAASHAFEQARLVLGLADARLQPREGGGLAELDTALRHLDEASPQVKRRILEAAVACITADHAVTGEEAELLRAISASIGCPMPPILSTQPGLG